jgi:hypothetical protein
MENILNKYEVTFTTFTAYNKKLKGCVSSHLNIQMTLGIFIKQLQDANYVGDLIDEINKVLNGDPILDEAPNDRVIAYIEQTTTRFCELLDEAPDYDNPDYTMPTIDLRDILIEWKAFLEHTH